MKAKILVGAAFGLALLFPFWAKAYDATGAQQYLSAHNTNPWSIMALSVLNTPNIDGTSLKNISSNSAIDYEAPILAITALGQNAQTFGSTDYVSALENFHNNSQLGSVTTINDDIFGILALVSSGKNTSDPVVMDSETFILAHQNSDGGWGFSTSASSDSNTTASAIVALRAAGLATSDVHIQNGLTYLKTAQNSDGGFTYDPTSPWGTASDSSSTAWALWALNATSQNLSDWTKGGHSPIEYLSGNQTPAGFFSYQQGSGEDAFSPVTTSYAIIALAGKTLPLGAGGIGSGGGLPATHDLVLSIDAGTGSGEVTSNDGLVTCTTSLTICATPYLEGTTVVLDAKAKAGSVFAGWSGDCQGSAVSCTVRISTEMHVSAKFTANDSSMPSQSSVSNPPVISPSDQPTASSAPASPQTGAVLGADTQPPTSISQNLPTNGLPRTGSSPWQVVLVRFGAVLLQLSIHLLKHKRSA
jgi:hypothetical protein